MVPTGSATASATAVVTSVPATSGMMPKRGAAKSGVQSVSVRKSVERDVREEGRGLVEKMPTMPTVIATEEKAASNSSASMTRSFT